MSHDPVKNPAHYTFSDIEPKKAIRAWGLSYALGSVVKYVVRAGRKGSALEDLKKAREFLNDEIEAYEKMSLFDRERAWLAAWRNYCAMYPVAESQSGASPERPASHIPPEG